MSSLILPTKQKIEPIANVKCQLVVQLLSCFVDDFPVSGGVLSATWYRSVEVFNYQFPNDELA